MIAIDESTARKAGRPGRAPQGWRRKKEKTLSAGRQRGGGKAGGRGRERIRSPHTRPQAACAGCATTPCPKPRPWVSHLRGGLPILLLRQLSWRSPHFAATSDSHLPWAAHCHPIILRMRVDSCLQSTSPHFVAHCLGNQPLEYPPGINSTQPAACRKVRACHESDP